MSDLPAQIGRYHVQRLLGEGGMGVLYLAVDPVLDRHVALKLLRVDSAELRRRFVREAQSAARIQHPNIVTVYDVGDHDGQLYIAMEYIDGDTLASLIRDQVPFSPIRKLDIIDDIADGLGFAHQRGIIHRDIKPANLMITRSGLVKVLDFGIARIAHRQTGEIEGPTLVGTPAYMAPEQLEGAEADARSDIYAVGLVTYELFTGRRAFAGATTADVLELVLAARPTPIEQLVPEIDPELRRVVGKAMARQPADRYPDLQAFRKDLARARRNAMAASADDATIVVGRPVPVAPTAGAPPPLPLPAAAARADGAAASRTAVPAEPGTTAGRTDETVFAPLTGAGPAAPAETRQTPAFDPGPVPVPLPSVPAGIPAGIQGSAGRATVDADVIGRAQGASAPRTSSPPRNPATPPLAPLSNAPASPIASAPPVASSPLPLTPVPSTRRGVPVAALLVGLVLLLGISVVGAFLVVRALGLFSESSRSARVEESSGEASPNDSAPDAGDAARPVVADVTQSPPDSPPGPPDSDEAPLTPIAPSEGVAPARPAEEPRTSPTVSPAPTAARTRAARPAADVPRRVPAPSPTVPRSTPVAEAEPPVVAREEPSRRESAAPVAAAVAAPREEAIALVRGYVAARNTSHASGIRRVWPGVDDVHIRRVTSAFSAPLTLAACDVDAVDATRAVARCRLTQPGSVGAYASSEALTVRRTFVFDLARQGGDWVIVGLRE